MEREKILAQRAQYEAQKQEALNRANLFAGAVEALDWVLAQIDAEGQGTGAESSAPVAPREKEG